ncbi:hypothetical protein [Streptomyces sp. ISL-94]|uniref:hypothetical protein n=1 Tax=Streptomyces sp. ISL-94 TaxID=2819190 RepID=UPI001BEC5F47|nr:hypothetical protein [Streptomyces sp. ISL-94]MBT2481561.1 hypothetical protein [Streptomyces sp. ISL-94]
MRHEYRPPQRRSRLTRRGRLALFLGTLTAIGAATLIPLLRGGEAPEKPRRLVIPEGWRAPQVYAAVDRALFNRIRAQAHAGSRAGQEAAAGN